MCPMSSNFEYSSRDKHLTKPKTNCSHGRGMFIRTGLEYEKLDFHNQFVIGTYEFHWIKVNLGGAEIFINKCFEFLGHYLNDKLNWS